VILAPISLARLTQFAGRTVPFWAIVLSDIIYSLTGKVQLRFFKCYISHRSLGFVNVILLFLTTRLIPDTSALPVLTTRRKAIDPLSTEAMGYTPFVLPAKVDTEKAEPARWSIKLPSPTHNTEHLWQSRMHTNRDGHSSMSMLLDLYKT